MSDAEGDFDVDEVPEEEVDVEPVEDAPASEDAPAPAKPPKPKKAAAPKPATTGDDSNPMGKQSRLPEDVLMQSEGIIPFQAGSNAYASQKGQTGFGVPRDVLGHIKGTNLKEVSEELQRKCDEMVRPQSGTNKFDSQKGMSAIGAVRDVLYKPKGSGGCEEVSEEKQRMGDGIIPLQSGTNKLASQKGMTGMGAFRLNYYRDYPEQDPQSQGIINVQMGTNQHASQAGMTGFGMPRTQVGKFVDEGRDEIPYDEGTVSKQCIGSSLGASQAGMTGFGAFRNNTQLLSRTDRASQGFVPFQAGINWGASQVGGTGFGQPRNQVSAYVDDARDPLPEELARSEDTPGWSHGYIHGASQQGMTAMGTGRDVKGKFLRRLW